MSAHHIYSYRIIDDRSIHAFIVDADVDVVVCVSFCFSLIIKRGGAVVVSSRLQGIWCIWSVQIIIFSSPSRLLQSPKWSISEYLPSLLLSVCLSVCQHP